MSAPSPSTQPARRLDTSALTEPLDAPALTAFIADSKARKAPWTRVTTGFRRPTVSDLIGQCIPVVIPLAGLCFLLYVGGADLIRAVREFTLTAPFPLNLVIVGIALLVVLGSALALVRVVRTIVSLRIPMSWWAAAYRLTRFAGANGLRYGHDERVGHPGVIFGTGSDRVAERRLCTTSGRPVEIGNYRYVVSGGDNDHTRVYGWGYVAITLDRRLPHMLLDAKANNKSVFGIKTSNLPIELAGDQKLSLGGEFDEKFTLYAPSEYGRDAFYVFTPDVMALFIDRLGTYDVEIIDDTMFVYGSRFDLLNPRTYLWLQELVDTVVARTVRRTERYTDDFAALDADPAQRTAGARGQAPDWPGAPLASGDPAQLRDAFSALLSGGFPSARQSHPGAESAPAGSDRPSVFDFAGDGPPRRASNSVAAGGRRLRQKRWTFWGVVGLLLIAFWIYNDFVAPLFGLPRLDHD